MRLLLARLSAVAILLGSNVPARSQVDVSNDLETIRTNRHMPGLSALAVKQGRIMDQGIIGWDTRVRDLFTNYQTFDASFYDATLDQLLAHRAGVQQGITFESTHWSQLLAQTGTIPQIRRWVSETVLKDPPEV